MSNLVHTGLNETNAGLLLLFMFIIVVIVFIANVTRKKKRGCLVTLVVSFLFIVLGVVGTYYGLKYFQRGYDLNIQHVIDEFNVENDVYKAVDIIKIDKKLLINGEIKGSNFFFIGNVNGDMHGESVEVIEMAHYNSKGERLIVNIPIEKVSIGISENEKSTAKWHFKPWREVDSTQFQHYIDEYLISVKIKIPLEQYQKLLEN